MLLIDQRYPLYITTQQRAQLDLYKVPQGSLLLFTQDGQNITVKKPDGTYQSLTQSIAVLGVIDKQKRFVPLSFEGQIAHQNSDSAIQIQDVKTWSGTRGVPDGSSDSNLIFQTQCNTIIGVYP